MNGYLDLHSHLLPGIDDGCRNLEDSFACVRRLLGHGFVGTVCTPHYWFEQFGNNSPAIIRDLVAGLQEKLAAEGLKYSLWAGGEVRICEDTIRSFKQHGIPTLGPSNFVLIDFWGYTWPRCGDEVVDYLLSNDFQPILAHPERMALDDTELFILLESLMAKGVRLQGNLNSISGGEGRLAQERIFQLLEEDKIFLIATDMHQPHALDGRMEGIDILSQKVGEAKVNQYIQERPADILGHG